MLDNFRYNLNTGHYSCCRWARGNGWMLMASSEALAAAERMGEEDEWGLRDVFLEQARALLGVQSDGDQDLP